jgi:hypothetical protein
MKIQTLQEGHQKTWDMRRRHLTISQTMEQRLGHDVWSGSAYCSVALSGISHVKITTRGKQKSRIYAQGEAAPNVIEVATATQPMLSTLVDMDQVNLRMLNIHGTGAKVQLTNSMIKTLRVKLKKGYLGSSTQSQVDVSYQPLEDIRLVAPLVDLVESGVAKLLPLKANQSHKQKYSVSIL